MRIGIDFHTAEREGSGNCTYIRNLVESLIKIDKENEYFLYITNINYPYYKRFRKDGNVYLCSTKSNNPFIRIPLLGIRTFIDKIDILHVLYIAPPIHRGKLVLTIHDVSFLHFPECFRKLENIRQKILIPGNIKKADKVLTISKHSKKDITENYNVTDNKVKITYLGVKTIFKAVENLKDKSEFLKEHGICGKFIFFLGRIDARKNIFALIKAFMSLKQQKQIPYQLVIAGKKDFLTKSMQKEIDMSNYKKDIIFAGYLSEETLPIFYNFAEVFVYPSLYEGFGLPCLEAMACGCPVISSNCSSIPEVVGDAGILTDPCDVDKLASAIYKVVSNRELKLKMKKKGLQQAEKFKWENTARETLEIYKETML
jgi:glycosyltransferase involved in cell wall biosynthesis